ncbi:MAG TPA: FG-GAP-like repeat-containing protein [Verrucomicrobiales bacterium]|nr:FG-GAP-like repeat-containing protein [Verrucomicrobiales bacterium]
MSPLLLTSLLALPCFAFPSLAAKSLAPASAATEKAKLFQKLDPAACGVDFVNPIDTSHPLKRLYIGGFACGGVTIGDLDGDGMADLYLTSGPRANRLYRQTGGLKFEDVTKPAGVGGDGQWSAGAALVDIEGDGDLDIYVCRYDAPNQLFINESTAGQMKFAERAKEYGLDIKDASLMPSFCDYDNDGDLDCFIMTRDFERAEGRPEKAPVEFDAEGKPRLKEGFEKYYTLYKTPAGYTCVNAGREDYLFRNDSTQDKPAFTNVSKTAGLVGRDRGNSAIWWDYNNDGWKDLYVANDFKDPDRLYRNNKDGTFTEVIKECTGHTTWFSMGSDIGDLNGDGRLDLLVADMAGTTHYKSKMTMGEMSSSIEFLLTAEPRQFMRNVLFLNSGTGRLLDAAQYAGLASSDWTWAVKLSDFDCDGRTDVFFSNGVARTFNDSDKPRPDSALVGQPEWNFYESMPTRPEQNLAWRNKGSLDFENVSKAWGLDEVSMSYATATGDLDGDGDLELVVANLDAPVSIYRNDSPPSNHRVRIRLEAKGSNRFGLGAVVRLTAGGVEQVRDLVPSSGFLSCNEPVLCFGLGSAKTIEKLTVDWPGGGQDMLENLAADQEYTIKESGSRVKPDAGPHALFALDESQALNSIEQEDPAFDDFQRQPLLPWKHSRLGPGMAWGDVDGDGLDDLYISQAKGKAGRIYFNRGKGAFEFRTTIPFEEHIASEDMAPLFIDAEGDGDLDLYVVSGSVECEPGAPALEDRLYLNDGKGHFDTAPAGVLPEERNSGSCALAADFDRDGDLDIFVGGRIIPGAWPEMPLSMLLRNDSKSKAPKFTDISDSVSGLQKAGLVTAGLWSDVDGDGWIDLLLCTEWGPVKIFLNNQGKLTESTYESGLAPYTGWWNGIAGRDLDHDGDIDYVATNYGPNGPYHASVAKPVVVYYGDLDDTGHRNIVEAKQEGSIWYPRRGFSCSSAAMPALRTKLKTFHNFASSSLADVYGTDRLDRAQKFSVVHLESAAFINDGKGHFKVVNLPLAAQLAPAFGVALTDLDGDGETDAVIAQNFFSPQPENGQLDSGLSVLLRGNPDGTFKAVEPAVSGIQVTGDAKSLTIADANGDKAPDVVVGVNQGKLRVFTNQTKAGKKILGIRLKGSGGNPAAAGARITVHGYRPQVAEVAAGTGYLSQNGPVLWFGVGDSPFVELRVRWSDGTESLQEVVPNGDIVKISQ